MLDALRFVASAVARKDYVPALTHYKIVNGRVTGFNGILALSSDIDVDLEVMPHAAKFLAAIKACPDTIALNVTPAGKLAVKSGKFKSFVECLPTDTAATFVEPEGDDIDLGPSFIEGIKLLQPAMGIDASRPWAMGIKLRGRSMFATNNIMLAEYYHGTSIPVDMVIPDLAIKELVRIGETPTRIQVAKSSISFWFGEKRWLRTNLLEGGSWPTDKLEQILSMSNGEQMPFPDDFATNLETIKPFLGEHDTVFLSPTAMMTSQYDGEGTTIETPMPQITEMQAYHHKQLILLAELAKTIDWTGYPRPCMFQGHMLRGAIVGQRL